MNKLQHSRQIASLTTALVTIFLVFCYVSYLSFIASEIKEGHVSQAVSYTDTLLLCLLPPLFIIAISEIVEKSKKYISSWTNFFDCNAGQLSPKSRVAQATNVVTSYAEVLCILAILPITFLFLALAQTKEPLDTLILLGSIL